MNQKQAKRALLLLCFLAVGVAGCVWTDTTKLPPDYSLYPVYGGHTVGQVLTCHHAGLQAIGVWMQASAHESVITLRLFKSYPDAADEIAAVTAELSPQSQPVFVRFDIPLQDDVNGKSFFVLIEAAGLNETQAVQVPYYPDSNLTLVLDGQETAGHLSYQLHYKNFYIVKDLLRQASRGGGRTVWLLFLTALLYLLPGGAAVVWLLREGDWIERIILAAGLSVAILALVMYLTMTGLRLNSAIVMGFMVLCAAAVAARWWLDWRKGMWKWPSLRGVVDSLRRDSSPLALAFVFVLVLGVRLWVVRDLVAPMWGDSYHHTMISQLMIENGGLFDSWEPYAPLTTFTYHFGFHANVAIYRWLSGDDMLHAMIWIGQIMNALAVLALYPLAIKVSGGNRWAGVGAVLVAGLLSPMPMYYVNWGRYTQLAGQVILPVAMWLTWGVLSHSNYDWKQTSLCWCAGGGLSVTHFRVLIFYVVFVIAWIGLEVIRGFERKKLETAIWIGAGMLVLFCPWFIHTFDGKIILNFIQNTMLLLGTGAGQMTSFGREYHQIGDLSFYLDMFWWLVLAIALGTVFWQRRRSPVLIAGWGFLLLILTNPNWLHLPGAGVISNLALFIAAYIPVSLLIGDLGGIGMTRFRDRRWSQAVAWGAVIVIGGWGIGDRLGDVQVAQHALVTRADIEAMAWIKEYAVPESGFLVNAFSAYGESVMVGSDAGWWLPLLSGCQNTVPPMNYGTEQSSIVDYRGWIQALYNQIWEQGVDSFDTVKTLQSRGITYVYIGQEQGRVNYQGTDVLDPNILLSSPYYDLVYHQDQVWIFSINEG